MSNSYRTARQVIEHQRKVAQNVYNKTLEELRAMEALLQQNCPHANMTNHPGFAESDPFDQCDDCGFIKI